MWQRTDDELKLDMDASMGDDTYAVDKDTDKRRVEAVFRRQTRELRIRHALGHEHESDSKTCSTTSVLKRQDVVSTYQQSNPQLPIQGCIV
jgi:hypothetical protein